MPAVSGVSSSPSSIQWEISGLQYSASQYEFYIEVWRGSTYMGASYNLQWTTSSADKSSRQTSNNLSSNTNYTAKAFSRYKGGARTYLGEGSYWTESVYVPPVKYPPSTPSISVISISGKSATIRAYLSNTTSLAWDFSWVNGYPDAYSSMASHVGSIDYTVSVPDYSSSYWVQARASNNDGDSSWSSSASWNSGVAPSPPSAVGCSTNAIAGTSFTVSYNGGSGANSVSVEVYSSSSYTGTPVWASHGLPTGTDAVSVTGLSQYTTYYPKVIAKNAHGNTAGYTSGTTLDTTIPTVSIASSDGAGRVWFNFNGADSAPSGGKASGMSSYGVWISSANGSSVGSNRHATINNLSQNYFTFQTDYNGASFVHNATYILGVRAFDASGNASDLKTVTITYRRARPDDWEWQTGFKYKNTNFNITASEWISLGKVINQFRTYRNTGSNLPTVSFTEPTRGSEMTAALFNQYRTAIAEITPKATAPPSTKSKNDPMLASDFNLLVQSLNSVT